MLSKSPWNPGGRDFYATGIKMVISHRQKCVDCTDFYFD